MTLTQSRSAEEDSINIKTIYLKRDVRSYSFLDIAFRSIRQ